MFDAKSSAHARTSSTASMVNDAIRPGCVVHLGSDTSIITDLGARNSIAALFVGLDRRGGAIGTATSPLPFELQSAVTYAGSY